MNEFATAALRTKLKRAAAADVIREIARGAGLSVTIVYEPHAPHRPRARADGQGSIYEDRSGHRWVGAYTVPDVQRGRGRRRLYVRGRTREDVTAKLEAAIRARDELAAAQAAAVVGS